MATWAIGDIQGCHATLERLLARVAFDPWSDRLWLVGDLVNRGPASLRVLRWAASLGDRVTAVLGNHDVKLLAIAEGEWRPKKGDTLDDVLEAPDRDELLAWLRARPLLHADGPWAMVHAGLPPTWSVSEAAALAAEACDALRSERRGELFARIREHEPAAWSEGLRGLDRAAAIVTLLTRLRTCTAEGVPCEGFSGPPDEAPEGCVPWYDLPRRSRDARIVFGHWAAQGLLVRDDVVGLDSGCVWGRELTAFCLEDGRIVQERCVDEVSSRGD